MEQIIIIWLMTAVRTAIPQKKRMTQYEKKLKQQLGEVQAQTCTNILLFCSLWCKLRLVQIYCYSVHCGASSDLYKYIVILFIVVQAQTYINILLFCSLWCKLRLVQIYCYSVHCGSFTFCSLLFNAALVCRMYLWRCTSGNNGESAHVQFLWPWLQATIH
jgi:hypothetical protein